MYSFIDQSFGLMFQLGAIFVNFSTYVFMAYYLLMLPNFCHAFHL